MHDVIVIGSGGAGLTAALSAASVGAQVLVLEASTHWGGSTAVSAGEVWVPVNHAMGKLGVEDSLEDALRYCLPDTHGTQTALLKKFVGTAFEMAQFVERHSPIAWQAMSSPDTFAERSGGRRSARHLEVAPLEANEFEPLHEHFWLPNFPAIFTNDEVFNLRLLFGGEVPQQLAQRRLRQKQVCTGVGLVAGLMQGARAQGVEFARGVRVQQLLRDDHQRICGVVGQCNGTTQTFRASKGVVVACGGFEWNNEVRDLNLNLPVAHPASPPIHHGDGLQMLESIGADIAHTHECWAWPVQELPGHLWPNVNKARHELVLAERCLPHVVWVNQNGERFVNEASHNCALELTPKILPVWAIADAQYRSRYPLAGAAADQELPNHVVCAPDLQALAKIIDVDEIALQQTIQRYNGFVHQGRDEDFNRGEAAYDRFYGDSLAEHPNLGTIDQPPFYAIRIYPGTVGTKGGARIDEYARVLDTQGLPITGLWAAGNAMASIIGPGTLAPGLTLGLALTWGYIAGQEAAQEIAEGR